MPAADVFTAWADWLTGTAAGETKHHEQVRDNGRVLELVVTGDTSSQLEHQHKSGAFASRPAAGNAGRIYYDTDMGGVWMDNGSQWRLVGVDKVLGDYLFDDFWLHHQNADAARGFGWKATESGSGVLQDFSTSQSLVRFATGATINSRVNLTAKTGAAEWAASAARLPAVWTVRMNIEQATGERLHIGLMGGSFPQNGDPLDGVFLRRIAGGNWFAVTRIAGVETAADTGIATGVTVFTRLEVRAISPTSIEFYIDDVLKATNTTNIPTANLNFLLNLDNTDAAGKVAHFDYAEILAKR